MTTLSEHGASVARMRVKHLAGALITASIPLSVAGGVAAAEPEVVDSGSTAAIQPEDNPAPRTGGTQKGRAASEPADDEDSSHPHGGQFSLRAALVGAGRIISRYDDSPTCGLAASSTEPKKFCGFTGPLALDLAIGFAPINSIEPFAWARFGLGAESTTHTKPLVVVGAGVRLYTASNSAFKFFLQPAVGWELESGTGSRPFDGKQYKKDILLQLLAGPQYDFTNNVGAFVGFGVTAGMLRAIQTWLEVDIGVQARF